MIAAIVIARGGSTRLPRKNVLPFCGMPLVAWSLIQMKCSRLVDYVYLSTDDDEIAEIGKEYGAEVIRRPEWPDANAVSANRVFLHALETIKKNGIHLDTFVSILPTSPLRKPDDIDEGIRQFDRVGAEHVWPAAKQRETTVYRNLLNMRAQLVLFDKNYRYMTANSGLYNVIRPSWFVWHYTRMEQELGDHDAKIDALVANNPLDYTDKDGYYQLCELWQLHEVDTMEEFELSELLMKHYILKGRGPDIYYDYARGEE